MVAERGINGNLFVAPDAGLVVPNLPITAIEAVVDYVARKTNECRVDLGDCLYQRDANGRIRRLGVARIVEAGIPVSHESKWGLQVEPQINGGRLRGRFAGAAG